MTTRPLTNLGVSAWRFCLTGGFVFAADYALLWLFSRMLPPVAAVSVAYLLAVSIHFCLNKCWVFKCRQPDLAGQLLRYGLTGLACWLCTVAFFSLSLHACTSNIYLAKAIAIPPTTLLGFLLMRSFVFRQQAPPQPSAGASAPRKGCKTGTAHGRESNDGAPPENTALTPPRSPPAG